MKKKILGILAIGLVVIFSTAMTTSGEKPKEETGKLIGTGCRPFSVNEDMNEIILDKITVLPNNGQAIMAWTPKDYNRSGDWHNLTQYCEQEAGRRPQAENYAPIVTIRGHLVTPENIESFDHPAKKYWPYYLEHEFKVYVVEWLKVDDFEIRFK